jgi:hypothetical protein
VMADDVPDDGPGPAPEDPVTAIHADAEPVAAFSSPLFTTPGGGAPAGAAPKPEIAIGAAFAGGFAIAMLLKRLGN